ncbi:EAL domain-containing protein [Bacillus pseudomycoides]|uniref:EAL domain-containing protein n=1 Tax=Bacillus pseudomycoides TaxID=64104 RepID=UPI003D6569CD
MSIYWEKEKPSNIGCDSPYITWYTIIRTHFINTQIPLYFEKAIHIVRSLANTVNPSVVAKGIETKEQLQFLHNNGCKYMQGYHKPLSGKEFMEFL